MNRSAEEKRRKGEKGIYVHLALLCSFAPLLLFSLPAIAQFGTPRDLAFWGKRRLPCDAQVAPYLLKQNFEGTGYDYGTCFTWTESTDGSGGVIDEDYTNTVLEGSQSLVISNLTHQCVTYVGFASQNEVWAYLLWRPLVHDLGGTYQPFSLRNGASRVAIVQVLADTTLRVSASSGGTATTVSTVTAGTTYHVWFHYKKGSGADAIADVGFSTDGVRPTSGNAFAQTTTGTSIDGATRFYLGTDSSDSTVYLYDKIRVDDAQIGDNPP